MKVGKPRRRVTVEPIRDPVPQREPAPVTAPAKEVVAK
jgi:hypothetical protein